MKKIITFLFFALIISSAFAQTDSGNRNNRNTEVAYYGNSNHHHSYSYQNIISQRDYEIQKVNYQNSWQVHLVVGNCDLNIWQKRDILDKLETQRIQNINNIYERYSSAIAYNRGNKKNSSSER